MATFRYKVRDVYGKALSGVTTGESKSMVAKHLVEMGYTPISVEETKDIQRNLFLNFFNKIGLQEMNLFTRQLVTLQKAGLPLLSSLEALKKQATNVYFGGVIQQIITDIEGGASLSTALSNHPNVFNDLYIGMVRAGEASGKLDVMLERIALLGEDEMTTKQRLQAATRYPLFVIITLVAAFLIIVSFVLPRFAELFSGMRITLPLPTRVLLGMSIFIKQFWYIVLLVLAGLITAFWKFINTKAGRLLWDTFRLKVVIFGPLVLMITMSRFSRVTGILIESGIPILHIFDLTKKTVGNVIIERALDGIRVSVSEGKGISEPMAASKLFSPMVIQMVAIGEETGKVDELLLRVADYYDSQIDYTLKNLSTLIEPILIFILGFMVLFMALAIFLPMWNMVQVFKR